MPGCASYGLTLRELATGLGSSETLASHYETARRVPSWAAAEQLAPSLDQVPPAAAVALLLTAPPPGPFAPGPLRKRRAPCPPEAANLRGQLRQLPTKARTAAPRAGALRALLAAVSPPEAALAARLGEGRAGGWGNHPAARPDLCPTYARFLFARLLADVPVVVSVFSVV